MFEQRSLRRRGNYGLKTFGCTQRTGKVIHLPLAAAHLPAEIKQQYVHQNFVSLKVDTAPGLPVPDHIHHVSACGAMPQRPESILSHQS
jgi:hypothetical protein